MSSPSSRIVPSVGSSRRSSSLPTVDLPQPDSPTRHSVSPGLIAKLTPSTALTSATERASRPRCSGKCFFRSATSTTGLMRRPAGREHALGLVAGDDMAAADRAQLRRLDAAARDRVGAARREGAAFDRLAQRRHDAGDFGEAALAVLRAQARDRGHQAARVGMRRAVEQLGGRGLLDLAARIHHDHAAAGLGHDAEIVRDQDHGGAGALLQLQHQVEDLRLDGHVERGGRLVGDQQRRIAGERGRDHHALAHAAGELVRIVVEPALGVGNLDQPQHLDGARARLRARSRRCGCAPTRRSGGRR